ncbi:MAG TPA: RidA family protein [Myxococcota bacterium]|nr:RidA family protein [Myxococcota bacterium]
MRQGGHLSGVPALTQYARSKRVGSLLFLAGVSARRADNSVQGASRERTGALEVDIRAQTEGCIENLRAALEAEGLGLEDVVDVTVFLVSMADYAGFNETWNRFFGTSGPTRTTVAVHQLPDPELAIELKAIASFA